MLSADRGCWGAGLEADTVAAIRAACTRPETMKLKQGWWEEDPDGLLTLDLIDRKIGDVGGAVLGAALAAMPSPLPYEAMVLGDNKLTDVGIAPIAAAIGGGRVPHLRTVDVSWGNGLGDEGRVALQAALPRGWCPRGDGVWIIDEQEWSRNAFWADSAAEHGAQTIVEVRSLMFDRGCN